MDWGQAQSITDLLRCRAQQEQMGTALPHGTVSSGLVHVPAQGDATVVLMWQDDILGVANSLAACMERSVLITWPVHGEPGI